MASPDKRTTLIRERKISKAGRSRKKDIRKNGTTKSQKELFGDS